MVLADEDGVKLALQALRFGRAAAGPRIKCGACLVDPSTGRALAWGVHRSLGPDGGFEGNPKCKIADIHAEADAIAHAARAGIAVRGAACYVTKPPCVRCTLQLAAAGVVRAGYASRLRDHYDERASAAVEAVAGAAGLELVEGVAMPGVEWLRSDAKGGEPRGLPPRADLEGGDEPPAAAVGDDIAPPRRRGGSGGCCGRGGGECGVQ